MMIFKSITKNVFRFTQDASKQIISSETNLINPISSPVACGYHFPKQWTADNIYSYIDPSKKNIKEIKIIHNKLGLSSGKILFTFYSEQIMNNYILRYSEDFIQTSNSVHRVLIKPFQLKTQIKKRQILGYNTKNGVKITNLDFDIDKDQLQRLAQDFGQVEYIDIFIRPNGLNKGVAKVYFKTKQQSIDFQKFIDDLSYKQRKLRAQIIKIENPNQKNEIKTLSFPKIVMEQNQLLFKRMMTRQTSQI